MSALMAYAVPAKRIWKQLTLENGNTVSAMLVGDEHGHWYVTADGQALSANENGKYAIMEATTLERIKAQRAERLEVSNSRRSARMSAATMQKAAPLYSGKKKGIVILVNFKDLAMIGDDPQKEFNNRFNTPNYTPAAGYKGSVHDYFYDQSYGMFDLEFDVVGPITVANDMAYYGRNYRNNDLHPGELVIEAVKAVDDQVNFKDYDWDGDGYVDQVFIVYAGHGEAQGGGSNTIWPHEWDLATTKSYGDGTGPVTLDGVKINTYAVSCELANATGSTYDGIGTACHEFSHCLGIPDFYDTNYSAPGMMSWDLMCEGSYNGPSGPGQSDGECPAAYTSYERMFAGWLTPTLLSEPCYVNDMPAITDFPSDEDDAPRAYIIKNDAYENEYYLLENRQQKKWDAETGGTGLLVIHVDYLASAWINNTVNDVASHQRMTYIPADGSYGTKTTMGYSATKTDLAGDLFPGSKNKTSLTNSSSPAATLYNANTDGKKFMNKPIEDISENNGFISFTFMNGTTWLAPQATTATGITDNSFTANWLPVEDAESYELEYWPVAINTNPADAILLSEDCSGFKGGINGADGSTDISSKLDTYTQTPGWTGQKLYNSAARIKMGAGSAAGIIRTPKIKEPESGEVTIAFVAKRYNDDATKNIMVHMYDTSGSSMSKQDFTLPDTEGLNVANFSNVSKDFQITFEAGKRAYLYSVNIYDGAYTADEITEALDTSKSETKNIKRLAEETSESIDTISVMGITTNSYEATDLTAKSYKYRVRALSEKQGPTKWSNAIRVVLAEKPYTDPDYDGIENIQINGNIASGIIYNINGQRMNNDASRNIPAGIYIMDGRKVIIK